MSRISVLVAAAIVAVSLLLSPNFRSTGDAERMPYAGDFLHEWVGGWIVRAGDRARLYDPAYANALEHDAALVGFRLRADSYAPMVYPPAYYVVVSPLSLLPYRPAAWAWTALVLCCFVATAVLLARAARPGAWLDRMLPRRESSTSRLDVIVGLVVLPLATCFMPFAESLVAGQKGPLWLLVFTVTFLLLRAGRSLAAGLVWGSLALKPTLALVLPLVMLAKRDWRFVLGCAVTAALVLATSLLLGPDLVIAYARFTTGVADYIRRQPTYVPRLHGLYGFFTLLAGQPTGAARGATVAGVAGVAGLVVWLWRGPLDPRAPRFLAQFAGIVLATILVSPHLLTYDLTILLLAFWCAGVLVLRGAEPAGRRRAVLWLLVALYVACGIGPSIARRTGVQLTTPIMLGLLAVLASWKLPAPSLTNGGSARHTS